MDSWISSGSFLGTWMDSKGPVGHHSVLAWVSEGLVGHRVVLGLVALGPAFYHIVLGWGGM